MSGISNYNQNESLATGFVRPKVTALFFDKIWVPHSLLQTSFDYIIPEEVLIREDNEFMIDGLDFGSFYKIEIDHNKPICPPREREKIEELSKNLVAADERFNGLGSIFSDDDIHTQIPSPDKWDSLSNQNELKFKYSKNRNRAIMLGAENFCRKYRVHISPIYHNLTEFEKDVKTLDLRSIYKKDALKFRLKTPNTFLNKDAFSICIQDFPSIVEDELSWEQVIDIRKDKKKIQQLRRFTNWANREFSNKDPEAIRETLEFELDAYKEVLKEYGIKTAIGSFSTIVSNANSIAALFSNPHQALLPILSISIVTIGFSVNTYFSNLENRNNPIAYLYDIENQI